MCGVDEDLAARRGDGVDAEHDGGRVGRDEQLDEDRQRCARRGEPVGAAVAQRAVGVRGVAARGDRGEQLVRALDAEDRLVLAGEGRLQMPSSSAADERTATSGSSLAGAPAELGVGELDTIAGSSGADDDEAGGDRQAVGEAASAAALPPTRRASAAGGSSNQRIEAGGLER